MGMQIGKPLYCVFGNSNPMEFNFQQIQKTSIMIMIMIILFLAKPVPNYVVPKTH